VPARTFRELLDWSRQQGQPLLYTSGGPGSYGHLWFEMVAAQQNLPRQHVSYSGVAPALRLFTSPFGVKT
jgi:tripartite-type tricarboxylate transporter receptor subunit TctC